MLQQLDYLGVHRHLSRTHQDVSCEGRGVQSDGGRASMAAIRAGSIAPGAFARSATARSTSTAIFSKITQYDYRRLGRARMGMRAQASRGRRAPKARSSSSDHIIRVAEQRLRRLSRARARTAAANCRHAGPGGEMSRRLRAGHGRWRRARSSAPCIGSRRALDDRYRARRGRVLFGSRTLGDERRDRRLVPRRSTVRRRDGRAESRARRSHRRGRDRHAESSASRGPRRNFWRLASMSSATSRSTTSSRTARISSAPRRTRARARGHI